MFSLARTHGGDIVHTLARCKQVKLLGEAQSIRRFYVKFSNLRDKLNHKINPEYFAKLRDRLNKFKLKY